MLTIGLIQSPPSAQCNDDSGKDAPVSNSHYIGLDVGTGSARAYIIDSEGELVGHASENIQQWQSRPGCYEQSTDDIWHVVCNVVREAIVQSGIDPHTVRSIAFAATCSLSVHTRDTDEPVEVSGSSSSGAVHNIILWMDRRADIEAASINSKAHSLLKYLGGSISVLMELPKVLWLKNNTPKEVFDRCKFYDLNDALTHIATGNVSIPCTAACDQETLPLGVDGTIKGWDREFLADIGLEDLVANDFEKVGGVCKHGRRLWHHAYAGWVGTVGAQLQAPGNPDAFPVQSRLALVAGTSSCLIVVSKAPIFVHGIWGPYKDWVLPGFWMSGGGQTASGQLLQHMLQIHPAYEITMSLAESQKSNIFEAATSSSMRGSAIGLTADKSLDSLAITYYGVIEFLALQIHQIISEMNRAGHTISSIFMSGSQCQNKFLVATIATACKLPVVTPRYENAAVCCGAALLAAKASTVEQNGNTEDLWTVIQRLSKSGELVRPSDDEDVRALLDVKYQVFLEQCERQRVFRASVDKVTVAKHKYNR
ncbi:Pentulose kinase [Mollisia scopiformis]|uniref:Pentulose kinase n=1 Tax=Mollisia scopiformis TaxID=149040 RepID=A0A194X5M1_MOLSC|nr:Pentulose kinase [Mollisia scopiformis]KUJ15478.1 Pentulose kinase [Mollisia scopiformis]